MQERRKKSNKRRTHPHLRVRIAIIGVGRLGTAMGRALAQAGYVVDVVVARGAAHSRDAGKLIGTGVLSLTSRQLEQPTSTQTERLGQCGLVLIATPDDVIGTVAEQLSASLTGSGTSRRVALHTSGALSSEILKPMRGAGFAVGSLHPLVSVSDAVLGSKLLRHAFFCVEGDRAAVRRARSLVQDLGGQSFTIDAGRKPLYHAAAVTASGHLVALLDIAIEMLGRCGLSPRRARQVLLPLVESTLTNLSTKEPAQALTGTFARGDAMTAANHLASIRAENLREALCAYVLLGKRSIRLAQNAGVSPSDLEKLNKLIAKASDLL